MVGLFKKVPGAAIEGVDYSVGRKKYNLGEILPCSVDHFGAENSKISDGEG